MWLRDRQRRSVRTTRESRTMRMRRPVSSMPCVRAKVDMRTSITEKTTRMKSKTFHFQSAEVKNLQPLPATRRASSSMNQMFSTAWVTVKPSAVCPLWCVAYSVSAPMSTVFSTIMTPQMTSNAGSFTIAEKRRRRMCCTSETGASDPVPSSWLDDGMLARRDTVAKRDASV